MWPFHAPLCHIPQVGPLLENSTALSMTIYLLQNLHQQESLQCFINQPIVEGHIQEVFVAEHWVYKFTGLY